MNLRRLFMQTLLSFLAVSFGADIACAQTSTRDGYVGSITKADKRKAGQQFTFANLQSSRPFVTFPNGNGQETNKTYEDNETIVLIFVSDFTGSSEMFYLSKKHNRFTLIEVSALEAIVMGTIFRPDTSYGTLK